MKISWCLNAVAVGACAFISYWVTLDNLIKTLVAAHVIKTDETYKRVKSRLFCTRIDHFEDLIDDNLVSWFARHCVLVNHNQWLAFRPSSLSYSVRNLFRNSLQTLLSQRHHTFYIITIRKMWVKRGGNFSHLSACCVDQHILSLVY